MGWAILGYDQRRAIIVLLLLLAGEFTMLRALVPVWWVPNTTLGRRVEHG